MPMLMVYYIQKTTKGDNTMAYIVNTKNGQFFFEDVVEFMLFLDDEGEGLDIEVTSYLPNATVYTEK